MFLIVVLFILYLAAANTVAVIKKVKYEDIAYHIASKQIEYLRKIPYNSLPASASFSDSQLSKIPSGAGNFTVTNHATLSGVKELTVTVTWNDGIPKQVVFKTLSGKGGINP
jgi:hypothetical protein